MAIRFVEKRAHLGNILGRLDDLSAGLVGTHIRPAGRTGIIAGQLDALTADIDAHFSPAPNRTGQIISTLDNLSGAVTGTFRPAGVSTFKPLQQFFADQFTLGQAPKVPGSDEIYAKFGNGYGCQVVNSDHLPTRNTCFKLSIQAGSSGVPDDGETNPANGFFGLSIGPPASRGSARYGVQGDTFHLAFKMKVAPGVVLGTTSLPDGALKFLRFGPTGIGQKADTHLCSSPQGFASLCEYDSNNQTNNSYPDTRSPSNNPANATYPRGVWTTIERMDFLHSNGNLAKQIIWVDDVMVFRRQGPKIDWLDVNGTLHTQTLFGTGMPTLNVSTAALDFFGIFTYWNAHPAVDTAVLIDGITTVVGESNLNRVDALGQPIIGSANIV